MLISVGVSQLKRIEMLKILESKRYKILMPTTNAIVIRTQEIASWTSAKTKKSYNFFE